MTGSAKIIHSVSSSSGGLSADAIERHQLRILKRFVEEVEAAKSMEAVRAAVKRLRSE